MFTWTEIALEPKWLRMNSNALLLIPVSGLPCVNGWLIWNKFDQACTSFPDARSHPSFLGAIGYLFVYKKIHENFRSIHHWIWFLLREYEFHSRKLMESQLPLHIRQEFS